MENSSTSKWKRQLVPSARSKAQATDTFDQRGNNARAEDGRRHEFSLDSLDKEILQTMSRGTSTKSPAPDSASCDSSSGSTQEKAMCSPRPEPAAVTTYSSESSTNTKKPSIGQFQAPPLPVWPSGWPEGDARFNEYKQQVAVNVNGSLPALKQEPPPNHWSHHHHHHHHRPTAGRSGATNTVAFDLKPDTPFRDLHSLTSRLDAACGEDHKQASHEGGGTGPYSGSVGMFAYPGTPQRLFPGGQRTEDQASTVVGVGSPGYHERPGGQRSGAKSKAPKVPPSKWDDAGKWIASPVHNDSEVTSESARSPTQGLLHPSPFVLPGMRLPVAGKVVNAARTESDIPNLMDTIVTTSSVNEPAFPTETTPESPLHETSTPTSTDPNTTSVRVKDQIKQIESAIQCSMAKLASPSTSTEPAVKRSVRAVPGSKSSAGKDTSVITSTMFVQRPKDSHLDAMISPPSLLVDLKAHQAQNGNPFAPFPAEPKPPLVAVLTTPPPPPPPEAPVKAISNGVNLRDSLVTDLNTSFADIFSNAPNILVRESATDTADQATRDMGTQMTPNPSVRLPPGTTFALSPTRHNARDHSRSATSLSAPDVKIDLQSCQQGGRRSQVPHPTLDRFAFNWSTREEEEAESAAPCLRGQACGDHREAQAVVSPYVAWAAAWEDAERAKYTARFHQEEAKIQAWEEHQKSKAETQMRRTETKLEKMHGNASQKMVNKIATAHKKAQDMRATAEACRDELASKAKHRAEYIRQTGNVPSTLGCFASRLASGLKTLTIFQTTVVVAVNFVLGL